MDLIRDGVVPPFRHVAAHVLGWSHAHDLASVRLPKRRVPGCAAFLSLYDFVQTLLVEIVNGESGAICFDRGACVGINNGSAVASRPAPCEAVLPEIRQFGFLATDAEDSGGPAEPLPAFTSQAPQIGK